ncbi:hypothetical protein QMK30_13960 [Streptomyces sp. H27-C3]|nr:hypothetical protein [Streptomyces sp. H27-C3]MDJ0462705.1 hypothetical protein [Streptomyces sp. H27-C3]
MAAREVSDEYLDGYARILTEVAATGRRLTRDALDSRRALGEQAADAGHGLRALVIKHLAATRAAWPGAAASADSVLAAVEQAVDAFAEGYERAQRMAVRQEEAARREFIDDLLHGRGDLGRLAARAERFGLRLSREHAVAVAEGDEAYEDTDAVTRRVDGELIGRFADRRILLATKDGRLICIVPGDQPDVLAHFAKQAHAATDVGRVAIGRHRTRNPRLSRRPRVRPAVPGSARRSEGRPAVQCPAGTPCARSSASSRLAIVSTAASSSVPPGRPPSCSSCSPSHWAQAFAISSASRSPAAVCDSRFASRVR